MKHLLISTAAVALLSGAAVAADLPVYEPAPVIAPVPVGFTWDGLYVGVSIGAYWGGNDDGGFDFCDDPLEAKVDQDAADDLEDDLDGILDDLVGDFLPYCNPIELPGRDDFSDDAIAFVDFDDDDDDDFGWLANAHIGVNSQMGRFVFGVEGEVKWLFDNDDDDDEVGFVIFEEDTNDEESGGTFDEPRAAGVLSSSGDSLDWLGLATLRAGAVLGAQNQALAYIKGGLAISEGGDGGIDGDCTTNTGLGGSGDGSGLHFCQVISDGDDDDNWNIGWTLGGGLEYKLTQNFSVGAEYLYVDLNNGGDSSALIQYQRDTTGDEVRQLEVSHESDDDNLHLVEIRASFHF